MLFKQSDLKFSTIQEASNILNESVYLDESEAVVSAKAIPVVENSRIGAYVVRLEDIATFSEDHGVSYNNAMSVIAEANSIDIDHLAVAVKETTIMANPGIVNELANVVVTPLPKTDSMYQFTEACVDAFIESGDTSYMDLLVEETTNTDIKDKKIMDLIHHRAKRFEKALDFRKNKIDKNLENNKLNLENEKSNIKKLLQTVKHYGYKTPKALIQKALIALRKKYNQLLQDIPKDKSQQKWYQKILLVIEKTINKLDQFVNLSLTPHIRNQNKLEDITYDAINKASYAEFLRATNPTSQEYKDAHESMKSAYNKANRYYGARVMTHPDDLFDKFDYYDY